MDIVDTHPHVVADDLQKYPLAPIGGKLSAYAEKYRINTEQFLQYMDETGVDQAVLVQSSTGHGYDNSYCADSAQRYPSRFVGVCCIDAVAPDAAQKLRYWIEERGMHGVRFFTAGSTIAETDWLDKPVAYPAFDEAERLGISVCVSLRRTGIPMLANALRRYPRVPIVLDHMASPLIDDGAPFAKAKDFLDLAEFPNLYLKVTTENLKGKGVDRSVVADFLGVVIERFGARRMMWGSNLPSTWGAGPAGSYTDLVELGRTALSFASEEDRRWILAETARMVYPALRVKTTA